MAYPSPCSPFGDLRGTRPEPGARVRPGHPGSAAEQFGLGGGELRVAQRALRMQFGELVEQSSMDGPAGAACCGGGCWYCCGGGCWYCCCCSRSAMRWSWSASACAASSLCRPECLPTAYAVPPTAAARSNGRRRLIMTCLLRSLCWSGPGLLDRAVHVGGQGEAEGNHDFRRGGDRSRPADLWRDRDEHAEDVLRRATGRHGVGYLPQVGGRWRVECDQGGDLGKRVGAAIQAGGGLPVGPGLQAREQEFRVAHRQLGKLFLGGGVNFDLGRRSH